MKLELVFLAFLCYSTGAFAVCVEGHVPIQKEYSGSVFVFTARVISSHFVAASRDNYFLSGTNYTLRPEELLKGKTEETVTVFNENSSGRFDMLRGQTYLVFIYREHGRLRIDNCGNSGLLKTSRQTLASVRSLARNPK